MDVDVAIVGAGPAGAIAALLCARAGLHTVLLDRAVFPRPKACGDCLSPELTRVLDRLGVLDPVLDMKPARLAGWRIFAPDGNSFEGRFCDLGDKRLSPEALSLSRDRLDAVLFEQAIQAGAIAMTGSHVTNVEPGEGVRPVGRLDGRSSEGAFSMRARMIVGADGLRSVVARGIGAVQRRHRRLRKISLTAHVTDVEGADSFGEMHVTDGLCMGLAPVNDAAMMPDIRSAGNGDAPGGRIGGVCVGSIRPRAVQTTPRAWNVTLVADAERFGREIAAEPARFFRNASGRFAGLGGRLDAIRPVGPAGRGRDAWLLRSGPFDVPTRRAFLGNVALAGDAAGYYDPFTGQGLHQAVTSAEQLAAAIREIILLGVPHSQALHRYSRTLRRNLRGSRFLQHAIEAVMSRPRAATHAISWLRERPGVVHALLAATGDLAPVRSLFGADMLRALVHSPEPGSAG
jgi:flavin-dependent dehydrogenase